MGSIIIRVTKSYKNMIIFITFLIGLVVILMTKFYKLLLNGILKIFQWQNSKNCYCNVYSKWEIMYIIWFHGFALIIFLPHSFTYFFCIFFYTLYANSSIPIRGKSCHVFLCKWYWNSFQFLSSLLIPFHIGFTVHDRDTNDANNLCGVHEMILLGFILVELIPMLLVVKGLGGFDI